MAKSKSQRKERVKESDTAGVFSLQVYWTLFCLTYHILFLGLKERLGFKESVIKCLEYKWILFAVANLQY